MEGGAQELYCSQPPGRSPDVLGALISAVVTLMTNQSDSEDQLMRVFSDIYW